MLDDFVFQFHELTFSNCYLISCMIRFLGDTTFNLSTLILYNINFILVKRGHKLNQFKLRFILCVCWANFSYVFRLYEEIWNKICRMKLYTKKEERWKVTKALDITKFLVFKVSTRKLTSWMAKTVQRW